MLNNEHGRILRYIAVEEALPEPDSAVVVTDGFFTVAGFYTERDRRNHEDGDRRRWELFQFDVRGWFSPVGTDFSRSAELLPLPGDFVVATDGMETDVGFYSIVDKKNHRGLLPRDQWCDFSFSVHRWAPLPSNPWE